jgi:hypothetical protein
MDLLSFLEKSANESWDQSSYRFYSFFLWIFEHDALLLSLTLIAFFVLLFRRLYVPLLFVSLLLLFFNLYFILTLPSFFLSFFYTNKDWPYVIRVFSFIVGIWGLARSIKEVKTMVLDNDRVIDSFNYIVEGGGGREDWVLRETERFIIDSNMPGIVTEQKNVAPEFLALEKRKFLIVRHIKYRQFRMFIGARSFGEHLDASWFLALDPGFFKRTVSKHATGNPHALSQKLDFFAQQDIKAFKTVSHECFKRALVMVMEELKLDPTALSADTKGYLDVW